MHQTVVLLHQLPDGTAHFDWLIDQPRLAAEHRLLCWRCPVRPDEPGAPFIAERLPDHRARYLIYEGPISAGRGTVARVAAGAVEGLELGEGAVQLAVRWGDRTIRYHGQYLPETDGRWRFTVV